MYNFDPIPNGGYTSSPAMEMLFDAVRPALLYNGKRYVPLPKGDERRGFGNAVFLLCPGQDATIAEIQSDYLQWYLNSYKWYTTDSRFRCKIGKKMIVRNMTQVMRRDWAGTKFPHPLKYAPAMQRKGFLKQKPNVLVDLGEWTKMYFQFSFKVSIPIIIRNYMRFLADRLSDHDFDGYRKIVYIPLNQWFKGTPLGFTKKLLNNPLSILIFAMYRYPQYVAELPDCDFIIGDAVNRQFILYNKKDFENSRNFNMVKMRLRMFKAFKWDEDSDDMLDAKFSPEEEDENSDLNNDPGAGGLDDPSVIPDATPEEIAHDDDAEDKVKLKRANRTVIINDMKRNLMGDTPTSSLNTERAPAKRVFSKTNTMIGTKLQPKVSSVPDITADDEAYDQEDVDEAIADTVPIDMSDPDLDQRVIDGVDDALAEILAENPDALLDLDEEDETEVMRRVIPKVRNHVKQSFMPTRSEEEVKRLNDLKMAQDKILKPLPKAEKVRSMRVETSDFSNVVKSTNRALTTAKFVNFDRDYNEKKLQSDIDGAVGMLAQASVPIFVTGKEEVDSSTQLDLKKTVTYHFEDEHGGKHKVKIDIPIIYEDKYVFLNGQKQLLGHQQIMMPLVKSNQTDVQIVTWYNKLILRREGTVDTRCAAVKAYISKHNEQYGIKLGNAMAKNSDGKHPSTLDIDMYARAFMSFRIGHSVFILDRNELLDRIKKLYPNLTVENTSDKIPVGYNTNRKEVIYVDGQHSLTDILLSSIGPDGRSVVAQTTKQKAQKLLRTRVKIMEKMVPLALLLFYFEGFSAVMKKAEIEHTIVDKDTDLSDVDRSTHEILELADKYVIWERNPIWNTMFMNSLSEVDLSIYELDELEDRDTIGNMLTQYFPSKSYATYLMQYYDFMIDNVTAEILEDFDMPTDLVSLMLLGNRMLADNSYTAVNNANAVRVRSNEIIAQSVYKCLADAYSSFRSTQSRMGRNRKPERLDIKQNAIISAVTKESSLTNEASVLNPILELEKARAITPRGSRGVGKTRAMTLEKRAYDPSMLGVMGITSSPDYKVGVTRQLTLEPNITSTRGYIQTTPSEELDSLSNVNLLTPSELLAAPGVLHDDGPRTAMTYKQSQYMLPVEGSSPVFFGNRVESVVPYHLSREFVVTAKDDGEVVAINDGIVVVKYKSGEFDSFDTNDKMKKNSSSGFFIKTKLTTHLTKVGQKFVKNEVLAQDNRAFTKSSDDPSAAMNAGVLVKMAIVPNYDLYEDASFITQKLSDKFTTHMSMKEEVGIPAQSYVERIVDVGDYVEVGDPLIVFDPAHDDEETNDFLAEIRKKLSEDLQSVVDLQSMPQVRTEYAGRISAIEIYTSVPVEELSPSLAAIVIKHSKHSKNVIKTLKKYQNPGDLNYYKCGQLIQDAADVVKPDWEGRVKGVKIGNDGKGVAILFYIEFKDIAKTGDKGSSFTALKFTTSHVIPKGSEPYSQYRPNEEISTFISPPAVLARKTPSIQLTMFTNKCLVELKRHALQIFFEDTDPREKPSNKF